jgi:hypothetical protein
VLSTVREEPDTPVAKNICWFVVPLSTITLPIPVPHKEILFTGIEEAPAEIEDDKVSEILFPITGLNPVELIILY